MSGGPAISAYLIQNWLAALNREDDASVRRDYTLIASAGVVRSSCGLTFWRHKEEHDGSSRWSASYMWLLGKVGDR